MHKWDAIQLYCQDESRFGLMTHMGRCLTSRAVRPVVDYRQGFKSTYLYGCFSLNTGDHFYWEIEGVSKEIFHAYLKEFSKQRPTELKIILIDNAGFHSTKDMEIPANIILINIPPYTPELNPAERVWQWFKQRFKLECFKTIKEVKEWIDQKVKECSTEMICSIVHNAKLLEPFQKAINNASL